VSAPTGSGKTVIFELAIIRLHIQASMQQLPAFKVVYSICLFIQIDFCGSFLLLVTRYRWLYIWGIEGA